MIVNGNGMKTAILTCFTTTDMTTKILIYAIIVFASILSVTAIFGYNGANKYKLLNREPPPPKNLDPLALRATRLDTIEQRVDNFDPSNHETYTMRFYRNGLYFHEGGPIFIMVGAEWTITSPWLAGGHMYDMAREKEGYMFYTEHRYYGQSRPTADASTENLRYLSVDQALADLAHFIVHIKKDPGLENAPVILVGGSYSGTMVAWFRKKYPHLSVGAWASSAPLLAKVDFIEFKEVIGGAILQVGGLDCYTRIENAFDAIEDIIANDNLNEIEQMFDLCEPLSSQYDIWSFFSTITDVTAAYVQYHNPGDIEGVCANIMNADAENDLDGFVDWIVPILTEDGCVDVDFESSIEFFRNPDWNAPAANIGFRQWAYQTCAEFGWFQTTGSRFQPFGSSFPVDFYYEFCRQVYGEVFNNDTMHANVERVNVKYGGLMINVFNVFFSHGMIDPWRPMGIQYDINHQTPANVIVGASHSADLQSINYEDPRPQLRESQELVRYHITNWIAQDQSNPTPFNNSKK